HERVRPHYLSFRGQLDPRRQWSALFFIQFDDCGEGIGDVAVRFVQCVPLGNQFRENGRGDGEAALGLWRKDQRDATKHVTSLTRFVPGGTRDYTRAAMKI